MKKLIVLSYLFIFSASLFAQYKNDNVLFRTVYTQDLCNELQRQAGHLILDVRTGGEYADTSTSGLNIGRFKNAKNFEVSELGHHIQELSGFKNKPVFVYCSHSQRSRRASKMLADSGFTKVFNINGGMSALRQLPFKGNECLFKRLTSANKFSFISAPDLCSKIAKSDKAFFLLDVRSDSAYRHISPDARINAYGIFKNTNHISLEDLLSGKENVPKGIEVIITDLFGEDAAKAAAFLKKKGYPKVYVLSEGFNRLLNFDKKDLPCFQSNYISPVQYDIMSAQDLNGFVMTAKGFLFLDVRSVEEFTNTHKNYWQNVGHLSDAVNIPASDLEKEWNRIATYKTSRVIIYGFGSPTSVYAAANTLLSKGFTNISVLQGGIFNIGWTAANVKGYDALAGLRIDIPEEKQ